jgi:hypothetical protein
MTKVLGQTLGNLELNTGFKTPIVVGGAGAGAGAGAGGHDNSPFLLVVFC